MELNGRAWGVDSCIAPIVAALNAGGIPTIGSCCGHGKSEGDILLADGRVLTIRLKPDASGDSGTTTLR